MVAAMDSVKGGVPIKRAALEYGVPRTMLSDRVNGRVVHGDKPGPRPYLSQSEEGNLSEFIQAVSQVGFPKTRREASSAFDSSKIPNPCEPVTPEELLSPREPVTPGELLTLREPVTPHHMSDPVAPRHVSASMAPRRRVSDPVTSHHRVSDSVAPCRHVSEDASSTPLATCAIQNGKGLEVLCMLLIPTFAYSCGAGSMGATPKRTPLQPLGQDILAKYLVQFIPTTPTTAQKPSASRVFGQRVLTSDQGYKILAEKARRVKREKKKAERLESKKRKEMEKKQKAEERKAKKKSAKGSASKRKKKGTIDGSNTATTQDTNSAAVNVPGRMMKILLKGQELSGSSVPVESGSMKSVFTKFNMMRMAKKSSVLCVQVCARQVVMCGLQ